MPHAAVNDALARRNALVLALAQALAGGNNTVIVSTTSIVGAVLAPDKGLATLPITAMVFGMWLGTLPVGYLARRFGRRFALQTGSLFGILSGLISYTAMHAWLVRAAGRRHVLRRALCCRAPVLSLRCGGHREREFRVQSDLVGAGRRRVRRGARAATRHLDQGSAAALHVRRELPRPVGCACSRPSFCNSCACRKAALCRHTVSRPMCDILRQPRYIVAVACGMASYGMMNMVMTSAPLAMIDCGHSVTDATLGIQWHVMAMYCPSFFTGALIARFGVERIAGLGIGADRLTGSCRDLRHHRRAFLDRAVLLGIGWNFAFIGATTMVTQCHHAHERTKVQSFNDFLIFGSMAIASFSSGQMLAYFGWQAINELIFPVILTAFALLVWLRWRKPAMAV